LNFPRLVFVRSAMRDLRFAARSAFRQPGLSALAIVALALGIGLTTTMFSIVNGAILRGLPFPESERIVHMAPFSLADSDDRDADIHTFTEFRDRQRSFDELAAFQFQSANVVGPSGIPSRYEGARTTSNTFRLLRVTPVLGRDFTDDDGRPGAAPVVMIGDRVWQERFDRSPDAIGAPLRVNGTVMTVVGVMPRGFRFPGTEDLWPALVVDPLGTKPGEGPGLETIGRLKPGVSMDEAGAEMAVIWRQLEQAYPERYPGGDTVEVKTYIEEFIGSETISALFTMLAAVFGVLIIACANVANLVLARAAVRTREIALRTAIGASRWQVVRLMLVEVLVLAVLGAAAGVALAQVGITLFNRAIVDTDPPFWLDIRIDTTVLAFVAAATAVAALVSGIVPALRASRADLSAVLSDEGRTTGLRMGRFSRALVVGEMAVSFGLLVMAGLIIQSLANLATADFGFAMRDVWSARVALPTDDYPDETRRRQFVDAALARMRELPGVVSVAAGTSPPMGGPRWNVSLPGQTYASDRDRPQVHGLVVSNDYFHVFRVMVEGRAFDDRDRDGGAPVAIVNRAFAERFYPEGALGRQVALATTAHREMREIVGIVPDLGMGQGPEDPIREAVYVPLAQVPLQGLSLYAHVSGSPLNLSAPARDAVRAVDANLPIFNIATLQEAFDRNAWPFRVFGSLFVAFGAAALFLATVGLYGVMAFSVRRRTPEIGVRMAMGADARSVLGMVLRQGLWQIVLGIVLGAGLGYLLGSAMSLLLFGVRPYDPLVFSGIAATLAAAGVAACLIPARRAARVDPMTALRYQ
jgi:predicted permease